MVNSGRGHGEYERVPGAIGWRRPRKVIEVGDREDFGNFIQAQGEGLAPVVQSTGVLAHSGRGSVTESECRFVVRKEEPCTRREETIAGIRKVLDLLEKWASYQEIIRAFREALDIQKSVIEGIRSK